LSASKELFIFVLIYLIILYSRIQSGSRLCWGATCQE